MSLPDSYTGATHTGLEITWLKADHTPYDLSAVQKVVARIQDAATKQIVESDGDFNIIDGVGGVFTWAFSAADLATPGTYSVQFRAVYSDLTYDVSVPKSWKVIASY